MNILKQKIDTRGSYYTGKMVGDWFSDLIDEARAKGYDGCKLIWWDVCEGWAEMTCNFENDE